MTDLQTHDEEEIKLIQTRKDRATARGGNPKANMDPKFDLIEYLRWVAILNADEIKAGQSNVLQIAGPKLTERSHALTLEAAAKAGADTTNGKVFFLDISLLDSKSDQEAGWANRARTIIEQKYGDQHGHFERFEMQDHSRSDHDGRLVTCQQIRDEIIKINQLIAKAKQDHITVIATIHCKAGKGRAGMLRASMEIVNGQFPLDSYRVFEQASMRNIADKKQNAEQKSAIHTMFWQETAIALGIDEKQDAKRQKPSGNAMLDHFIDGELFSPPSAKRSALLKKFTDETLLSAVVNFDGISKKGKKNAVEALDKELEKEEAEKVKAIKRKKIPKKEKKALLEKLKKELAEKRKKKIAELEVICEKRKTDAIQEFQTTFLVARERLIARTGYDPLAAAIISMAINNKSDHSLVKKAKHDPIVEKNIQELIRAGNLENDPGIRNALALRDALRQIDQARPHGFWANLWSLITSTPTDLQIRQMEALLTANRNSPYLPIIQQELQADIDQMSKKDKAMYEIALGELLLPLDHSIAVTTTYASSQFASIRDTEHPFTVEPVVAEEAKEVESKEKEDKQVVTPTFDREQKVDTDTQPLTAEAETKERHRSLSGNMSSDD